MENNELVLLKSILMESSVTYTTNKMNNVQIDICIEGRLDNPNIEILLNTINELRDEQTSVLKEQKIKMAQKVKEHLDQFENNGENISVNICNAEGELKNED